MGIIIALVLRGIFILLGAQLIENFSWIFYIFGAFLLCTAVRQVFAKIRIAFIRLWGADRVAPGRGGIIVQIVALATQGVGCRSRAAKKERYR
ncbi:hypothetical protein HDC94_002493 [Leifsonia sp. AK011]|nr:hypothetical protein [Leifsonia sp. AK011]